MSAPTPHFCLDWARRFVDQAAEIVASSRDSSQMLHEVRVKASTAKMALLSAQSFLAKIDVKRHPMVLARFQGQLARLRANIEHDPRFDAVPDIRNLLLAELTTEEQPSQMSLI